MFYAVVSILESECYGTRFDVRIRMLGTILNQDFVANRTITEFLHAYEEQLRDPDRFTILSYHDLVGDVIANTCVNDAMVLKPAGDTFVGTAPAARRSLNIKFLTFKVDFDFSHLFLKKTKDCIKTMSLTTTVELPQTIYRVLDTTANTEVSVSTFAGPGDICAMTADEFQAGILDACHQSGAFKLVAPVCWLSKRDP